jgi:hypothetical protein
LELKCERDLQQFAKPRSENPRKQALGGFLPVPKPKECNLSSLGRHSFWFPRHDLPLFDRHARF